MWHAGSLSCARKTFFKIPRWIRQDLQPPRTRDLHSLHGTRCPRCFNPRGGGTAGRGAANEEGRGKGRGETGERSWAGTVPARGREPRSRQEPALRTQLTRVTTGRRSSGPPTAKERSRAGVGNDLRCPRLGTAVVEGDSPQHLSPSLLQLRATLRRAHVPRPLVLSHLVVVEVG